jgi:pimeloyl-ACP methyl ester carboxylesterase
MMRSARVRRGGITRRSVDRWVASLKRSVPDARVVDLPGAGHYVFLTREADVLRGLKEFVADLH